MAVAPVEAQVRHDDLTFEMRREQKAMNERIKVSQLCAIDTGEDCFARRKRKPVVIFCRVTKHPTKNR